MLNPVDRAESLGAACRRLGDPREANPYLEHRRNGGPDYLVDRRVAAWWRGWDGAEVGAASTPDGARRYAAGVLSNTAAAAF